MIVESLKSLIPVTDPRARVCGAAGKPAYVVSVREASAWGETFNPSRAAAGTLARQMDAAGGGLRLCPDCARRLIDQAESVGLIVEIKPIETTSMRTS